MKFDFMSQQKKWGVEKKRGKNLLRTPPKREAFKHSGGDRRLCTSATVTLYFEVEDSKESRPGTEQKMSVGTDIPPAPKPTPASLKNGSCFAFMAETNTIPSSHAKKRAQGLLTSLISKLQNL